MLFRLSFILLLLSLTSCVTIPVPHSAMLPPSKTYATLPALPKLHEKIEVKNVAVPEDATAHYAKVTKEQFAEALRTALQIAGLASKGMGNGKYYLDATIVQIEQPSFGLNFTVNTRIKYKLYSKTDNVIVYEDTITLSGGATMAEAFKADERVRLATGKALSENITHLIKVLATKDIQ